MLAAHFKPKTPVGEAMTETPLPDWLPPSPFQPDLFSARTVTALQKRFSSGTPFPHVHIRDLGSPEAMAGVRHDILNHMTTVYRETDLFRVSQTMDLNNVPLDSEEAKKTPHLMALRAHMYSPQFREFLETVTGCGELSDRVDCAANLYTSGSHLLCHDDVITTRKLSYIIYLSVTPDDDKDLSTTPLKVEDGEEVDGVWRARYGGALELFEAVDAPILPAGVEAVARRTQQNADKYDGKSNSNSNSNSNSTNRDECKSEEDDGNDDHNSADEDVPRQLVKVPLTTPSRVLAPVFNSMAVFEVKAGASFHAVQEVFTYDARRISIQGWFHFAGPRPEAYDKGATLRLLQSPLLPVPSATATATASVSSDEAETDEAGEKSSTTTSTTSTSTASSSSSSSSSIPAEVQAKLAYDMCQEVPSLPFFMMTPREQPEQKKKAAGLGSKKGASSSAAGAEPDALMASLEKHLSQHIAQLLRKDSSSSSSPDVEAVAAAIPRRKVSKKSTSDEDGEGQGEDGDEEEEEEEEDVSYEDPALIRADLLYLRKFVNMQYTVVQNIESIRARFMRTGVLHLSNFLREDVFERLAKTLLASDVADGLALVPDVAEEGEAEEKEREKEGDEEAPSSKSSRFANAFAGFGSKAKINAKKAAAKDEDEDEDEDEGEDEDEDEEEEEDSEAEPLKYKEKRFPPPYSVGVNSFTSSFEAAQASSASSSSTSADSAVAKAPAPPSLGSWRVAGPSFKQRVCVYSPQPPETYPSPTTTTATTAVTAVAADALTPAAVFAAAPPALKAGATLHALLRSLFQSSAFSRLLQWLTAKTGLAHKSMVRRFRPGLDYTVGSYDSLLPEDSTTVLDVVYSFVDEGHMDHARNVWKVGKTASSISAPAAPAVKKGFGVRKSASAASAASAWEPYPGASEDEVVYDMQGNNEEDEDDNEDEEDEDEDEEGKDCAAVNKMIKKKTYKSKRHMWESDDFGGFNVRTCTSILTGICINRFRDLS